MPTAAIGQALHADLTHQLGIVTTFGLAHVGVPISADAIASLFGVGTHHGVGETPDAVRIALRVPAFCGRPTREEAERVLEVSVAQQHAFTAALPSLTRQRRERRAPPDRLESVLREPASPHMALIASPKTHAKNEVKIYFEKSYGKQIGTPSRAPNESMVIENAELPHFEQMALTS